MQEQRFVPYLFKKAEVLGNNKKRLLNRLKECLTVLNPLIRKELGKYQYDFDGKRLIGENNDIAIQWYNNGHTSEGLCTVVRFGKSI